MNTWLIIALIIVLLTAILSLIFGQGELNLGQLKIPRTKVARETKKIAAVVECKGKAEQKENFCIYTVDRPLDYYVVKDGSNYIIYGPTLKQLYMDLGLNLNENATLPAETYSITNESFAFNFIYKEKGGISKKDPSFVLENPDQSVIDQLNKVRFIEVKVTDQIKIRLNTFSLPAREIRAS